MKLTKNLLYITENFLSHSPSNNDGSFRNSNCISWNRSLYFPPRDSPRMNAVRVTELPSTYVRLSDRIVYNIPTFQHTGSSRKQIWCIRCAFLITLMFDTCFTYATVMCMSILISLLSSPQRSMKPLINWNLFMQKRDFTKRWKFSASSR